MTASRRSVLLIASSLTEENAPLQPWRYLLETGRQLAAQGYKMYFITDRTTLSDASDDLYGVPVWRVKSVSNPRWHANAELFRLVKKLNPATVLWHMGLTSILHQRYALPVRAPIIGIFTSPIYRLQELRQPGLPKILAGYRLSLIHLLGALIPRPILRHCLNHNDNVHHVVVQTATLGRRLRDSGLWRGPLSIIPPGVDDAWHPVKPDVISAERDKLGYTASDKVVVYFGSPAPLRGLSTLVRAFKRAVRTEPKLNLLILSRQRAGELAAADAHLRRLLQDCTLRDHVQIISGFLPQADLVRHVAAADIVALPFEIVPSDAPLTVLEARALHKPIVLTPIACLPELAGDDKTIFFAEPSNPVSLSSAIERMVNCLSAFTDESQNRQDNSFAQQSWEGNRAAWSKLLQSR